jgi:hypothetical protein
MLFALSVLLLAQQVIGPFSPAPAAGPRPWERDATEDVVRVNHQGPFEGRTTMWVRVHPKADDPRVAPTTFVFASEFAGRSPRTRPAVTWYIETNVKYYPLLQRTVRFEVSIDGVPPINLLARGEPTSVGYCCGGDDNGSLPASVTIALSAERLDRLAAAKSVRGNALGVPFTVDQRQLTAIAEFRQRLLADSR